MRERRRGGGCEPTRCPACCTPGRRGSGTHHSGELTAIIVDRIEALDGLHARWLPAASLAIGGPLLVAIATLLADPVGALVLVLCGLLVPIAMAAAGIGARRLPRATSSWR